jgi:hypothetical protein
MMMARPPLGLLVCGDNHLLLRGPLPDRVTAGRLVRLWMFPTIGTSINASGILGPWRISTREFREEIAWAVVWPSDTPAQPAVAQLLSEVAGRGIAICDAATGDWPGFHWEPPPAEPRPQGSGFPSSR